MTNKKSELVVHKEFLWGRFAVVGVLVIGVFVTVGATFVSQELRSKAFVVNPSPSPLVATFLPSDRALESPYVRLGLEKKNYSFSEDVPVYVLLNTQGKEVSALHLVAQYDPDVLDFDVSQLAIDDYFKSVDVAETKPGTIDITFFVTTDVGQKAVSLAEEKAIALLPFKSKLFQKSDSEIKLDYDQKMIDKTGLVGYFSDRTRNLDNQLKSVEGAKVTIQ